MGKIPLNLKIGLKSITRVLLILKQPFVSGFLNSNVFEHAQLIQKFFGPRNGAVSLKKHKKKKNNSESSLRVGTALHTFAYKQRWWLRVAFGAVLEELETTPPPNSEVESAVSWVNSESWKTTKATKKGAVCWHHRSTRILRCAWLSLTWLFWNHQ